MSKIICDICGTSYPETAKQCPICGCVRPGDVQRVTNEVKKDGKVSTGYTYVKGGRFSKSNVKKRTKSNATEAVGKVPAGKNNPSGDSGTSIGLVITAIVLLLAIIGVVLYIAIRFFAPISGPVNNPSTSATETQNGQVDLSCKGLILDTETVVLSQIGEARLLYVEVQPANCKDTISFRSENAEIATVSDAGKITAVAEGTTKIIITCGEVVKECEVICQFTSAPTQSTEPSTAPTNPTETTSPTNPAEAIRLNRKDITFSYKGESWVLYSGTVAKNLITWSSDDEAVVTFVDGKAVAVGPGMTEVHAEYDGQKVSCIIRCNFKESSGVGGTGGVTEDGGGTGGNGGVGEDGGSTQPTTGSNTDGTYKVYTQWGNAVEDVTIAVGEKVGLILKDESGNAVTLSWTVSGNGCTVSGGVFTGTVSGTINTATATYNGKTYSCIIRVK